MTASGDRPLAIRLSADARTRRHFARGWADAYVTLLDVLGLTAPLSSACQQAHHQRCSFTSASNGWPRSFFSSRGVTCPSKERNQFLVRATRGFDSLPDGIAVGWSGGRRLWILADTARWAIMLTRFVGCRPKCSKAGPDDRRWANGVLTAILPHRCGLRVSRLTHQPASTSGRS